MGTVADRFSTGFRDYTNDGDPVSGIHEPIKSDLRALGGVIEDAIAANASGLLQYDTKALLDADTGQADNALAIVTDDSTASNNGLYLFTAGSPGSWSATSLQMVLNDRAVNAAGLATGGGALDADRTITVTAASQAEAEAGTATDRAVTPLGAAQHVSQRFRDAGATGLLPHPSGAYVAPDWAYGPFRDPVGRVLFGIDSTGAVHIDEHARPPGVDLAPRAGRMPLYATDAGQMLLWLENGGVFGATPHDLPMAYIAPVNGIDQAFVCENAGTPRQISFEQSNVVAAQVIRPGRCRIATAAGDAHLVGFQGRGKGALGNVWSHLIVHGQSLSVGFDSESSQQVHTTTAPCPDFVKTFNGGPAPLQVAPVNGNIAVALAASEITSLVGAVEDNPGTNNFETGWVTAGLALAGPEGLNYTSQVTVSAHGHGSTEFDDLKKGTQPWQNMLDAAQAHADLATAAGASAEIIAFPFIHGTANASENRATYLADLNALATDVQTDLPAITGQTSAIPVIVNQITTLNGGAIDDGALAQLDFGLQNANGYCAGPRYAFPFSQGPHLTSWGYIQQAEMVAKVANAIQHWRQDWKPLYLSSAAEVTSTQIDLRFVVPVPPIQIASEYAKSVITAAGLGAGSGIEIIDSGGAKTITSVEVIDDWTIRVTLDSAIGATGREARVAWSGNGGQGPVDGARSLIHDSDDSVGVRTGTPLVNWACHSKTTF